VTVAPPIKSVQPEVVLSPRKTAIVGGKGTVNHDKPPSDTLQLSEEDCPASPRDVLNHVYRRDDIE